MATKAKIAANRRYDRKTYRKVLFALRVSEDADILRDLDRAQEKGLSRREWLREIYEKGSTETIR